MKFYNMKGTIFLISLILMLGVNAQIDKRRVTALDPGAYRLILQGHGVIPIVKE